MEDEFILAKYEEFVFLQKIKKWNTERIGFGQLDNRKMPRDMDFIHELIQRCGLEEYGIEEELKQLDKWRNANAP